MKKRYPKKESLTPKERLSMIAGIIESVDNRCLAADGAVSNFKDEVEEYEMRTIYRLAAGLLPLAKDLRNMH